MKCIIENCERFVCNKKNGGTNICAYHLAKLPPKIREKFSGHYYSGRNFHRFISQAIEFLTLKQGV